MREWLTELDRASRRLIGVDIKTVQLGWPIGMPVVRKMEPGLREVRTNLVDSIARVLFAVEGQAMVLLHGFIKKVRKHRRPTWPLPGSAKQHSRGTSNEPAHWLRL